MRTSTHLKLVVGFGAATSLLGLFTILACLSTYQLLDDGRRVAHTLEVLEALEGTMSRIFDAETDQHGYLLTGDSSYLRPFEGAISEAGQRLERLEQLTADNLAQHQRLGSLRPLVEERFTLLHSAIQARRNQGTNAARDLIATDIGRSRMDTIRALVSRMMTVERQLLEDRVQQSAFSAQVAYVTYAALLIVVIGLLWAVFRVVKGELRDRAIVEEALRQSRERYEVAVRGSRDGLWDWDLIAGRCYYSPRWKSMLGHEDAEVSDSPDEFGKRVHPDDADRVNATVAAYLESKLDVYEQEVRLLHKDGGYRWILTRGVALRDEAGKPCRMSGSHTDITLRKQAEGILSDQNRRLEAAAASERQSHEALKLTQSRLVQSERLAGLGQMVAGVAHEINNPLSFVINNAAVLSRDVTDLRDLLTLHEEADDLIARDNPSLHARIVAFRDEVDLPYLLDNIHKLLRRSDDGLKRIEQVVKDLRLFARLDESDVKEADLNAGVQSTATIIRGNARRDDVELKLDLNPLPPVTCFPAKINQVIMNLLSNAVDACDAGGCVTVRTRYEGESIQIEVNDTGNGIDPSIRDRIFDPFFTTKPVGQGTGLGLSISYGIIQEHGGTIEVESSPGCGTTFVVKLPLAARVWKERDDKGEPQ